MWLASGVRGKSSGKRHSRLADDAIYVSLRMPRATLIFIHGFACGKIGGAERPSAPPIEVCRSV